MFDYPLILLSKQWDDFRKPEYSEGNMAAPIGSGKILCRTSEIRLDRILKSGQSFR